MSPVVITIFFVGIAALVNVPPGSDVKRIAIFPTALAGEYRGVQLAPHRTYLYLPGAALVAKDKGDACANEYKGTWDEAAMLCTVPLSGALVWTRTSEPLTETATFRKIPSFARLCPDAVDLPAKYVDSSMIASEVVAAHVDIVGGTASGCRRDRAFVTKLDIKSDDGALYVRQNGATRRILLNTGAIIAIETKEQESALAHTAQSHFGWYYFLTKESTSCPIVIPEAADPTLPVCPAIPGVVDALRAMTSSLGTPECGNTNFP